MDVVGLALRPAKGDQNEGEKLNGNESVYVYTLRNNEKKSLMEKEHD